MRGYRFETVLTCAMLLFVVFPVFSQEWPPANHESKPGSRWWWLGSAVDEKNLEIQTLNNQIASQNEEILDLKNNIVNKDNLVALQREIDSKNVTIREKDFEIKMLKDKSVSREEFSRIQDELDKKKESIKSSSGSKSISIRLKDQIGSN